MPVQVWTPGQVLTAAELTTVTNLELYPTTTAVSVNPCVAGNFYTCTTTVTMTLPSAATVGNMIGIKLYAASGTITINRAGSDSIYTPTGSTRPATSLSLTVADSYIILVSDGANWHEVASYGLVPANSATVATSQTTTSTSYTDLATTGPAVTLSTGVAVTVSLNTQLINNTVNDVSRMGFAVSGATTLAASDNTANVYEAYANGGLAQQGFAVRQAGLTGGSNVVTAKYDVNGGTGTFANRNLIVNLTT